MVKGSTVIELSFFFFSAFLINSQDRIIRVFDSQIVLSCQGTEGAEPEPIQKLQDLVNRWWMVFFFYVILSLASYIWRWGWHGQRKNSVRKFHHDGSCLILLPLWIRGGSILCKEESGSVSVSGQLCTYPSPNPTLTLICCQLPVVELGEG